MQLPNAGDPTSEVFPKGPEIGERIPAFTLPDQQGSPVHFGSGGQHKSLILFHRSASW